MDSIVQISSAAVSDRGLSEKRPHNEDSFLELPQRGIYAVADGVGGAQAGEVASQMAMEILGEAFANAGQGDAETLMRAAIERANTAIYDMAQELPQLSSMATTIVALHLNGNIATIGHVGDSRLYRLDRDGDLHRDTDDHSMVAEEVRAGRMTEEQAETHPSRNIISRALGAEATVEPDLKTIMVEPGTAFLLCSDGITRHVTDQEIKGVLTFGGSPQDVCEYLKKLCFERGAEDNLTAVVVRLGMQAGEHDTASPDSGPVFEEPTVATARNYAPAGDDLLDLDTRPLTPPPAGA
jgi:serine/threonine protein phosphatase PrpC